MACTQPPEGLRITPEAPTTDDDLLVLPAPGEGDPWSYRWSRDGDVQLDLVGNVVPRSRTARDERWSVVVTRRRGQRASDPVELDVVIANAPPTVQAAVVESDAGLAAVVRADDPDGDAVTTGVTWTLGDEVHLGASVPRSLLREGDVWTLIATATDVEGLESVAVAQHTVGVVAPAVTFAKILPDPATAADDLTVEVQLDDPSGIGEPVVRWTLDGDDVHIGPTLPAGTAVRGEIVMAWIRVDDGAVSGPEFPTAPLRITNSPPTLEGVEVQPPVLAEGRTARCEVSGWNDADGDPVGVRTKWFVNGVLVTEGDALGSSYFDKGDLVSCEGSPSDPEGVGAPRSSDEAPVINTPPAMARVEIQPNPPTGADPVEVVAIGTVDADGDPVELDVIWSVDGTFAGNDTVLGSPVVRGQEVSVAVTPFDGEDPGVTLFFGPVVVANAPPVVVSATILPDPPLADHPVSVAASLFDPDGDVVDLSIRWKVDNRPFVESAVLDRSYVTSGATITAELVPHDGLVDGPLYTTAPVVVP